MAFSTLNASSRVTQRPAPRAVAAAVVVPRTPARARQQVALPPGRDSLRMIMRSSDTGDRHHSSTHQQCQRVHCCCIADSVAAASPAVSGADNDDKLVSDSGEILQGKQVRRRGRGADGGGAPLGSCRHAGTP
jgi:hypothetical protein